MGMQQWSAKGTARVIGGTLKQLVDKLVHYRTIGKWSTRYILDVYHT